MGAVRSAAGPHLGADRVGATALPGHAPPGRQRLDILRADPPDGSPTDPATKAVEPGEVTPRRDAAREPEHGRERTPAWVGTLLPKSDADTWLAAAFADYEPIVAAEMAAKARAHDGKLDVRDRERMALSLFVPTSRYLTAAARRGGRDLALRDTRSDLRSDEWYEIAAGKGVLVLAALRSAMGHDSFTWFMDAFGRENAGTAVDSAEFFRAAAHVHGQPLTGLADAWLGPEALTRLDAETRARHSTGRFWSVNSFEPSSIRSSSCMALLPRRKSSARPPRCSSASSPAASRMPPSPSRPTRT